MTPTVGDRAADVAVQPPRRPGRHALRRHGRNPLNAAGISLIPSIKLPFYDVRGRCCAEGDSYQELHSLHDPSGSRDIVRQPKYQY